MAEGHGDRPDLDEKLAVVVGRADLLGSGAYGDPVVSFTSLWLGFMIGGDPLCLWLQATAREIGPRVEDVLARWRDSRAPAVGLEEWIEEVRRRRADQLPSSG